jgi:hypothetical protein
VGWIGALLVTLTRPPIDGTDDDLDAWSEAIVESVLRSIADA